jgi:hypothetical protein
MRNVDEIEGAALPAVPGGGAGSTGPGRELAFVCGGLSFLIVDEAGAGIAARLEAILASAISPSVDRTPPDVRYVVDTWQPKWGAIGTGYRVSRDEKLRYLGTSLERVAQWLRADIDENVARASSADLLLHAAVVAWRERAILICGPGRCGTSTLAAELVRNGAMAWSDGLAVVDDQGAVRAYPGSPATLPIPVALVVSAIYFPEVSWEPARVQGARAALPIIASALQERNDPGRVLRLSARIAATALILQGARPEASDTAPRILAALDEWLDGRPEASGKATESLEVLSEARHALVRARNGRSDKRFHHRGHRGTEKSRAGTQPIQPRRTSL